MSDTNIFQFKQFAINQTGCAMKVNTDGVLLGALANANDPRNILDIGTGTGVIALMLAQRYRNALIDAVEIDHDAAERATANFAGSPFSDRCTCYAKSFEQYFAEYPGQKYDLIVSNPPFFLNSLKSAGQAKQVARHTTMDFFSALFSNVKKTLYPGGCFWLILPVSTSEAIKALAESVDLNLTKQIDITSFDGSIAHRNVLAFSEAERMEEVEVVVIYSSIGVYTARYASLLKGFLTIF